MLVLRKCLNTHSLEVIETDGKTTLISKRDGPQIHFNLPQETIDNNLLIHCRISSSVDTLAKFYFQTPEYPYYFEGQIAYNFIKKGKNDFCLRITKPGLLSSIRFDPEVEAGEYILEELVIAKE